jgi:hypothetical protein
MRHNLLSLSFLLVGCFQPNTDLVKIICADPGQCPEGQTCVLNAGEQQGICAAAGDMAMATPTDGGTDAATDGSSPAPDMSVPLGCKNPGAVAVPDATACSMLVGFFAADQPAYWVGTMSQETCGTALGNQLLYGCGAVGRAGVKLCGSFPKVIDLGTNWSSSNGTLAQAANTNPAHGILCCKAGQKAVACPGTFASGQASQQCASGFVPCQNLP